MRYDLFVSYRHAPIDTRWAKWLADRLARLRAPRRLVRDGLAKDRVGPVFRDNDRMAASPDLSRAIDSALEASNYLVVICSPRTSDSPWVDHEISRFRALGRSDRILALLVEGEPSTSFPPGLRVVDPSGGAVAVEPRAASIAPEPGETARAAKRRALLAIAAPLLGCEVGMLLRRVQEAAARRRLVWAIVTGVLCAVLATLTAMAVGASRRAEAAGAVAHRAWIGALREQARLERDARRPDRALALVGAAIDAGDRTEGGRVLFDEMVAASRQCVGRMPGERGRAHVVGCALAGHGPIAIVSLLRGPLLSWDIRGRTVNLLRESPAPGLVEPVVAPTGEVVFDPATGRLWSVGDGGLVPSLEASPRLGRCEIAVFSADGSTLATYLPQDGRVTIARLGAPGESRQVDVPESGALLLAFSPTGRVLFIAGDDLRAAGSRGFVRAYAWDRQQAGSIEMPGAASAISALAFSERLRQALIGTADGSVYLWPGADRRAGKPVQLAGPSKLVTGVAFVEGRDEAVAAALDGTLRTWAVPSGKPLRVMADVVGTMVTSRDGRLLATAGRDRVVRVRRTTDWRLIAELAGHSAAVGSLAFDPDGKHLLSSDGSEVRAWSVPVGSDRPGFASGDERVAWCSMSPDGAYAVSALRDGECRLARLAGALDDVVLADGAPHEVSSVCASSDGARVAVGDFENRVTVWDAAAGTLVATVVGGGGRRGGGHPVGAMEFARATRDLAVGFPDGTLVVVDDSKVERLRTSLSGWIDAIAWGPGGRWVAVAQDQRVRVVGVTETELSREYVVGPGAVERLIAHPSAPSLLCVRSDGGAVVLDVLSGRTQATVDSGHGPVVAARFDAQGEGFGILWRSGRAVLIPLSAGRPEVPTDLGGGPYVRAALSPDLRSAAVASPGGVVEVVDMATAELLTDLASDHSEPHDVVYASPSRVSVLYKDGSVRSCEIDRSGTRPTVRPDWRALTPYRLVGGRLELEASAR